MNKKVNHQHLLWTALTPAGTNLTRWAVTLAVVMTCLFATTTEAWAQESGEEPQIRILTLGSGWNANGATVAASYLMGDETVEYTGTEFSQEPAPVPEGSTVTLTITPGEGYLVDKVSVTKYEEPEIVGGIESRTRGTDGEASVEVSHADGTNVWSFTMPAYDVEVTVAYKKAPETQTETVTNPDGTKTTTETIKETVTDKDGKVIQTKETIKETVTDKDGKVIQTKETIKETVTNPDGTETTTENTKETVTNPDGSQTITTSKTPEMDVASGPVKIDNDDNTNWHKIPPLKDVVISDNPDHVKLLIEQGHESNVLINSVTEKDAQGQTTATSGSMTVKQNGSIDGTGDTGPTQIAFGWGLGSLEYRFNVDIQGHGSVSVPFSAHEGDWVTITVTPDNGYHLAKLHVTNGGSLNEDPTPTSDPSQYTFQIPTGHRASTGLTIQAIFEADGTGGGGGGGSAIVNGGGAHEVVTTMTINYQTKKATDGGVATVDGSGGTRVTAVNNSVALRRGSGERGIIYTRGAAAEEEDDEIEIVSGQEYELLHDGYIVLNFYTPDADITVNSIVFRRPGDANNDGFVDAVDLVEMINAKNGHASERFNLTNADIDRDGTITQADIDAVVHLIIDKTTD